MITPGALIVAILAGSIPVGWFFIVRWFMSKDVAETERLDELELAELTPLQRHRAASASKAGHDDAHFPDLTRAGAH